MDAKDTKMKQLYKAVVRKTNKEIKVYRRWTGSFIDYADCTIEYQANELRIISEIKT